MIAKRSALPLLAICFTLSVSASVAARQPDAWKRHTIDNSSRGADGVRVADVNGDGRLDFTTGWEEGGRVRVYLHPGLAKAKSQWPAVTVGKVKSPEDAMFVDLNGDGAVDVVSCCEGRERTVFVHWAPAKKTDYLDPRAWRTEAIPCTVKAQSWMFAVSTQLDGKGGPDLILGSKGGSAAVGMLLTGTAPENVNSYRYVRLANAGWIMSLELHDVDGDGDQDVVYSDRKGKERAVWWLERPAQNADDAKAWKRHLVGGAEREVMFLDIADLDGKEGQEIVTATRDGFILVDHPSGDSSKPWRESRIPNPLKTPNGKAVRVADIDRDGAPDLVHSCNNGGKRQYEGVVWMRREADGAWETRSISGERGVKFDLLQLIDIDEDGDLDVVTCEERDNLGVFWYENPTIRR